jgi:hypothetical protein
MAAVGARLSEDQQLEIRRFLTARRTALTIAPLVLLVLVTYEARSVGLTPIYQGIAISIPLILFFLAQIIVRATFGPMLADVDAGVVETVTGEVTRAPKGGVAIGDRRVRVTLPAADGLRAATGKLTVYVLPKSGLVVGFERC